MRQDLKVYMLYVAGLFGRNRKPKNGMFKLAEVPADKPMPSEDVVKLAKERLTVEKVKPGATYQVIETDEYLEIRGEGAEAYMVRGFQLGKAREVVRKSWVTIGG